MIEKWEVVNVRPSRTDTMSVGGLIIWINKVMEVDIKELSDLSSGDIYCQLMARTFRGSINLSKVYFYTKDLGFAALNFKLLKKTFLAMNVKKDIPLGQLLHGKGHFEFLKWFYTFCEANKNEKPYEAKKARDFAIRSVKPPLRSNSDLGYLKQKTNMGKFVSQSLINVANVTPKPVKKMCNKPYIQDSTITPRDFDEPKHIYLNLTDKDETKKGQIDIPFNQVTTEEVQLVIPGNADDFARIQLDEKIQKLSSTFESIKQIILPCEALSGILDLISAIFDVLLAPDDQLSAKVLKVKEMLIEITKTKKDMNTLMSEGNQ